MKIKIAGRHTDASAALRSYVVDKTEALERFFDRIISVDVVLSVEKERQIADLHAHLTNRKVISAREESTDMYASIDRAVDRLKRQLVKFKDHLHGTRERAAEAAADADTDRASPEKEIIRSEAYFQKPMSPEEAALQLDAIDKEFLVFVDVETDRVAIIYHRRDGNYGLIEPRT
ncbi:ribosome-associated translation inhibitor RaiA [Candidatus Bipolaricaulota bacterium]|nr:ribosome-associated translation inhibitor RaiA [Candidatus Bipolaricaulota bacterium]